MRRFNLFAIMLYYMLAHLTNAVWRCKKRLCICLVDNTVPLLIGDLVRHLLKFAVEGIFCSDTKEIALLSRIHCIFGKIHLGVKTKKNSEIPEFLIEFGGQGRDRTGDTRIFSPLLYQLSYLATLMEL